jgi:hypothetical protein
MQVPEEMGFQVALMENRVCPDVVAVQIHLQMESFILRKEYNAIPVQKMPKKLQIIPGRKRINER